jgi:hypothetical protein
MAVTPDEAGGWKGISAVEKWILQAREKQWPLAE